MYNTFGGYPTIPMNNYQQRLATFESTSVVRVNGWNGANSYTLAPNSSILLLDETAPIVYLKTTDGAGYGTVTPYDIVAHKDPEKINVEDRIIALETKISSLEAKLNEQPDIATTPKSKQSK